MNHELFQSNHVIRQLNQGGFHDRRIEKLSGAWDEKWREVVDVPRAELDSCSARLRQRRAIARTEVTAPRGGALLTRAHGDGKTHASRDDGVARRAREPP